MWDRQFKPPGNQAGGSPKPGILDRAGLVCLIFFSVWAQQAGPTTEQLLQWSNTQYNVSNQKFVACNRLLFPLKIMIGDKKKKFILPNRSL